jgi:hypothetical protein
MLSVVEFPQYQFVIAGLKSNLLFYDKLHHKKNVISNKTYDLLRIADASFGNFGAIP